MDAEDRPKPLEYLERFSGQDDQLGHLADKAIKRIDTFLEEKRR